MHYFNFLNKLCDNIISMNKLDSFDYKILKIVQKNNKVTSQELAKEVDLSSSACQRRLNSMRKTGVIERDISVLDRNQLNRKITIIVQILSDIEGTQLDIQFKNVQFHFTYFPTFLKYLRQIHNDLKIVQI